DWGAFPALIAYFAQTHTVRWDAVAAAAFAVLASHAQRVLSTPVRDVRRRVAAVKGTILLRDGRVEPLDADALTAPAERALKTLAAARVDERLADAESRLAALVEREAADRAAELERTLARARADAVSLLADEERRIADERRALFVEREQEAAGALSEALAETQKQVERRLEEWSRDLDRAADAMRSRLTELTRRQHQLTAEAEQRI